MANDRIAQALVGTKKADRQLALVVLSEVRGYFAGLCGEYCGADHEHCALKEYRALRRQLRDALEGGRR